MRFTNLLLAPSVAPRILFGAAVLAVPLAALLSFSVQPLVAKALLPVQGGGASTWLGAMLFFQFVLLLGYGWAAWLLGQTARRQVGATVGLAVLAMFATRLTWATSSPWTGLGGIFLTLMIATGPAMILLFSIAPLMHGWLQQNGRAVPYYLYALSSVGGLLAVLLYPFTIERSIGLSEQMFFWRGLLWILAGVVAVAGLCFRRIGPSSPNPAHPSEPLSSLRLLRWIGLSALTCAGMLGATHLIAAEIGSAPIAWVGPFGLYILSFVVIFSGHWQSRFNLVSLGWLAVSLTGYMLTKGVSHATVDGPRVLWLLSLTAAGSFFGNGLLHESRPAQRFALFYLVLAAGGVLGGLFASIGAPLLFLSPSELIALSSLLLTFGLVQLLGRREVLPVMVTAVIVLAPVIGLVWTQTREQSASGVSVRRFRDIYGSLILEQRASALILSNETTTHGSQMTTDQASRRRPTLYFTESSGVGRVIEEAQKKNPAIAIASVGLGAGTLAAYARATDSIDFWDIDPQLIRIARDFFTFISDSPGKVDLHLADGRKGLEASTADYDVIVIDAFCGDGIPTHLLTREALAIYFARLKSRQGILVIHTSNRYSNFLPVVGATAHTLGWSVLDVVTEISATTPDRDWDADGRATHYLLVCPPPQVEALIAALPLEEDDGRVKRAVSLHDPLPPGRAVVWTDDRHAALDCLDLRSYLIGK